ncbi:MAG: heme-copper oxidase subunit III [Bacteroidetes bacterium]|nr:heme-copper oxidase subunit III [Bacteroidota bacterium]
MQTEIVTKNKLYSLPFGERRRGALISDGAIGMSLLIATELMFFAGLISAYLVNKAGASWPPYGQPRLPIEITAMNTFILLLSSVTLYFFRKKYAEGNEKKLLIVTLLLGFAFVTIQGIEWVKLLQFGLTTTSSLYGAFFYTLIGAHGFHVIVGLCILLYILLSVNKKSPNEKLLNRISACSMYWYFVVGIWPVLYILVYLS